MEAFQHHIYICQQKKPEGAPSCLSAGAERTLAALRAELATAGLEDQVQVTPCDCLGRCDQGPNLVVYPEGAWYSRVTADLAPEIVKEHLAGGHAVTRLLAGEAAALKTEIQEHFKKVKGLKAVMDKAGMMPEEVNSLIRGFQESRVLLTAVELDLFTAVGPGHTADQIAQKLKTHPRATESLANALCALNLLFKKDGVFANSPLSARFLVAGSPDDSRMALMHVVHLWPRWSTLTEAVTKGTAVFFEPMANRGEDWTVSFIAAMHKNASFRAPQVVGALDLAGVRRVLDLGGGSGAYAMAFARKKPDLEVTLFDLPTVVPLAQKYFAAAGLEGRIQTRAGDMTRDPYGENYDLIFISAICHMFSPEENLDLFKRIKAALAPGGRLVLQDFILNDDKTAPRMGALFALNMLVGTRAGGAYSGKEYLAWLSQAGFIESRVITLPGPTSLVEGKKPGEG